VWIERDRMRAFKPAQYRLSSLGQNRGSAKSTIDMQPKVFCGGKLSQIDQRIDCARVGCAGVCNDTKRTQTFGAIARDRRAQILDGQSKIFIALEFAHLLWCKTDHAQRSLNGGMGLIRKVNSCAFHAVLQQRVACCDERGQVCHRSAADKEAARSWWQSANLGKPPNDGEFNRGRRRSAKPRSVKNIEAGGKRVRHCAHKIVWTRDKGKKARMIDMQVVWKNFALQLRKELVWITPRFGRIAIEKRNDSRRIRLGADRPAFHAYKMLGQKIDNSVAELSHFLARKRDARAIKQGRSFFLFQLRQEKLDRIDRINRNCRKTKPSARLV
jgi:hypothetical protein